MAVPQDPTEGEEDMPENGDFSSKRLELRFQLIALLAEGGAANQIQLGELGACECECRA